MIWVENYPCTNKREGEAREQHWMDSLKSNMNTIRAFVTEEQKQEEMKEYKKESYENNKEAILEKNKEHYKNNKEAFAEKNKERYENDKEKRLEKKKEHYKNNKDAILAKQKVQFDCECGGKCAHGSKSRHFRSKKHQDWQMTCVETD